MKAAILLLLVGLYDLVRSECDPPFEAKGSECFYTRGTTRTWSDGQAYCQSLGGYLAVPSNVTKLHEYLHSKLGRRPVWIGGTDVAQEGVWESFINGQPINSTDFRKDQPDNDNGNQDCLELGRYRKPDLVDADCNIKKSVVCEKDDCPQTDCPSSFTMVGDECLYISSDPLPWKAARSHCHGMGGDLTVPSDLSSLSGFVEDNSVWIGGTDMETEGTWLYVNGSSINNGDWSNNETSDSNDDEDCLEFIPESSPPLNANKCEETKKFVCEAPPMCKE